MSCLIHLACYGKYPLYHALLTPEQRHEEFMQYCPVCSAKLKYYYHNTSNGSMWYSECPRCDFSDGS